MNSKVKNTVLVVGASDKEDRYSNRAIKMLLERNYQVIGIHPFLRVAEGVEVYPDMESIPIDTLDTIDTVTMYVNPQVSDKMTECLSVLKPRRVIWNPGSENVNVAKTLSQKGVDNLEACTLVLLSTQQF